MDETAAIVGVFLLVVAVGLAIAVSAVSALIRVGRLEKTVRDLEQRIARGGVAAQAAALAADAAAAVPPSAAVVAAVATTTVVVTSTAPEPIPAMAGAPLPAAPPTASSPARDLEAVIAGRWLNRVGLVAVAIGVSYFLKYAIDNDWIGPAGQVSLGLLLGAGLIAGAPMLARRGYTYFADGLIGLGAVVLYLSVWAGGSYYQLFSRTIEFAGMVGITAGMLAVALGRQSPRVALLALVGGFATPALVSTGQNAEVALFSYLALLNMGLLAIVWLRNWRRLEWPAFILTQAYFWIWYGDRYRLDAFAPTMTFALVFFAEFVAVPMFRARRSGTIAIDSVLLVVANAGLCLVAGRAMLWPDDKWMLTGLALALAAVHLAVAAATPSPEGARGQARLVFAGVALTLATIAIPVRLEGRGLTLGWAVEAAVLVVTGLQAGIRSMRGLGFALFGVVLARVLLVPPPATTFFFNGRLLVQSIAIASLAVAVLSARRSWSRLANGEHMLVTLMGIALNVLVIVTLTSEVMLYFDPVSGLTFDARSQLGEQLAISVLWSVYGIVLLVLGVRQGIAALRWQALVLFGVTTLKVFFLDLGSLSGFYRIASSLGLGVVLLIVSFLYQRRMSAAVPEQSS